MEDMLSTYVLILLVAVTKSNLQIEDNDHYYLSHFEPLEKMEADCTRKTPEDYCDEFLRSNSSLQLKGKETLEATFTRPNIPYSESKSHIYYLVIKLIYRSHTNISIYANKRIELEPRSSSKTDLHTGKVAFKSIRNGNYYVEVNFHLKETSWGRNIWFCLYNSPEIQVKNEILDLGDKKYSLSNIPQIELNSENHTPFEIYIKPRLTAPYKVLVSIFYPDRNKSAPILRCLLQHNSTTFSNKMGEVTYDNNGTLRGVINHTENVTRLVVKYSIDDEWCIGKPYNKNKYSYFWNNTDCLTNVEFKINNFIAATRTVSIPQANQTPQIIFILTYVSLIALLGMKYIFPWKFKESTTENDNLQQAICYVHTPIETAQVNIPVDQPEGAIVKTSIDFKILLLYARESGSIAEEIHKFRELLMKYFKCEVIDIFSDSYEQELNIKGIGYLLELLNSNATKIKIILIHSKLSTKLYQANLSGSVIMEQPEEPFDSFYLNAIQNFSSKNDYTNIFNVEFAKFPVANRDQRLRVNSLANYIVPTHNDLLFKAILGN